MEQQRQTEPVEPRFDRTQAEEALLIAARLQQEHHEQFSLSELKKTAVEVDISPEFIDQALRQMQAQRGQERARAVVPVARPYVAWTPSLLESIGLGAMVTITQVVLVGLACGNPHKEVPTAWILALMLTGFFAWKLPKGATGRGAAYLGLGFTVMLSLLTWVSLESNDGGWMSDVLMRFFLMTFLQVCLYFGVRWYMGIHYRLAASTSVDHPTESRVV